MTGAELVEDVKNEFTKHRRKFATGLAIAIGRFLRDLDAVDGKFSDFSAFADAFPVQTESKRGGRIR